MSFLVTNSAEAVHSSKTANGKNVPAGTGIHTKTLPLLMESRPSGDPLQ